MISIETSEDGSCFDVIISDRTTQKNRTLSNIILPMHGAHNVQNALSVIAIANEMGIADSILKKALGGFEGVKRRFTKTGEVNGISIIDDYAHHPVEIAAVISAARAAAPNGRIISVVQPHRYSRLRDLFNDFCTCFNDADVVIVAEVYSAGEEVIEGINQETLVEGLRSHGHRHVESLRSEEVLAQLIDNISFPGDMVVCLGAGSITNWANALPEELATLKSPSNQVCR